MNSVCGSREGRGREVRRDNHIEGRGELRNKFEETADKDQIWHGEKKVCVCVTVNERKRVHV